MQTMLILYLYLMMYLYLKVKTLSVGGKRFVPPTASEVAAYCKKKNYDIDAEEFVAFYASKGWMIGKNKMVSWHGAIGTWVAKRRKERGGHQNGEVDDTGRVFMDGKWVVV